MWHVTWTYTICLQKKSLTLIIIIMLFDNWKVIIEFFTFSSNHFIRKRFWLTIVLCCVTCHIDKWKRKVVNESNCSVAQMSFLWVNMLKVKLHFSNIAVCLFLSQKLWLSVKLELALKFSFCEQLWTSAFGLCNVICVFCMFEKKALFCVEGNNWVLKILIII